MITNVAVLSDIHGVLPVLEAVLDEPEVAEADLIVVTGDHAAGPQPVAVLDRLLDLGDRVLLVRGNVDRELVAVAQGKESTVGEPYEIDLWAAQQLSAEHVALLADLPHPMTLGSRASARCSATAHHAMTTKSSSLTPGWSAGPRSSPSCRMPCRPSSADTPHMPFTRLVDRRLVVNPGSIGMPYGRAGGHWALLRDGGTTLRRTNLDIDAAIARVVAESDYPDRQTWADDYLRATSSDANALTSLRTPRRPPAFLTPTRRQDPRGQNRRPSELRDALR